MNPIVKQDVEYIINSPLQWERFKNKTILISGANSFLASYMIHTFMYLNETRDYNIYVHAIVRDTKTANEKYKEYLKTGHFIIREYFWNDSYNVIDYIIQAASPASPHIFNTDPVGTILPNVILTNDLLRLSVDKKAEFLFFSTSGVYGHKDYFDYPLSEHNFGSLDCSIINNCYLEAKRCAEMLCIAYFKQYNVPVKIVRPGINYGYGMKLNDGRSINTFIKNILNNEPLILIGSGDIERSFMYIADAALAFFTVMLRGSDGEAYNVTPDKEISIKNLLFTILDCFPHKPLLRIIEKGTDINRLSVDFSRTFMDNEKLKDLGWQNNFSIEQGLLNTVMAYEQE